MEGNETPLLSIENQELRFGGFWIRVGAFLLDFVITIPLVIAGVFVEEVPVYLALVVAAFLYKPVFEGLLSATPGKMLLGLRLVNKKLGKIGWLSAIIRTLVLGASQLPSTVYNVRALEGGVKTLPQEEQLEFMQANLGLLLLGMGLGFVAFISCLFVAFHSRKRGLHDMLAETFVVYKETLPRA